MLIDTSVIVEIAKKQNRHRECLDLLDAINQHLFREEVYLSQFGLSALQAILGKINPKFLQQILLMIYHDTIKVHNLKIVDNMMTLSALKDLGLDFDDATQFISANKLNTYIVTLDKDFKKTGIQIKTPQEVLGKLFKNY